MQKLVRRASALLLAAALFTLSGCYFLPEEEETLQPPLKQPEAVSYKTHTVETGNVEKWLEGTGYVVAVDTEEILFSQGGGNLKAVYVKAGQTVNAGDLIAELYTGSLEDTVYHQKNAVCLAQLSYDEVKNGDDYYAKERARIALTDAQYTLNQLQQQLEDARVYASISGTVTYVSSVREGDYVDAFQRLATISDTSHLQVRLATEDADSLQVGQTVTLSYMGQYETTAQVMQVPSDAPEDASEEDKNAVLLEPAELPEDITIGATATVQMLLDTREDVIVLPAQYISTYNNRKYVRVLIDGVPEERDVTLGLYGKGNVYEILSGLSVGEQVVVS